MREIETLDKQISDLRADLNEIKNAQFIGGYSWVFYRHITGKQYDMYETGIANGTILVYRLAFKPETALAAAGFIFYSGFATGSFRNQTIPTQGVNNSWDIRFTALQSNWGIQTAVMVFSPQKGTISVDRIV